MRTVLQVGAFPWPTGQGSQVYVRGMASALARRGDTVVVACWAGSDGAAPREVDVVRGPRVPGAVLHSGLHWSRLPQDLGLVGAIARVLRRRRVDVIHAHNVEAPVAARMAMRRAGVRVPLVWTPHTIMAEELPTFGGPVWLGAAADRAALRAADVGVAISRRSAEWLEAHGVPAHVVPPGIDLEDLAGADATSARERWDLRGPWVVYTGNADAYQDLDLLVAAMRRVPEAGLLVVTGSDPGPVRELAAGLKRLRVVHSSRFDDHRDALAAADVAALPRRVCPGFPIKLLNYLGLGVPTVACGAVDPMPGVVTVAPTPEALAEAMRLLVAHPERRLLLGRAGRAHAAEALSWERGAERLQAVYADVTRGREPA